MVQSVVSFPHGGHVDPAPAPVALPGGLVIAPARYLWGGLSWDCSAEAAYRFWQPGIDRTMRITWGGDIDKLMRSLAWITAIGSDDEALTPAQITDRALWSKPRLMCDNTCEWALSICASLGITARIVRALTASEPTNYYDGHVMLEVQIAGQWKLYDLAAGLTFNVGGGSAREVVPLPVGAIVEVAQKSLSIEHVASSVFDALSWVENTLATPSAREAEWRRILQIVGIDRPNGETWWRITPEVSSRQTWLLSLSPSYRAKTPAEFDAAFYAA